MGCITDWEAFSREAQALFTSSGGNARLLVKYRHKEGQLVVKVTDGPKTIKFITGDKDDIRFIERLQQWFLTEGTNPANVPGSAEQAAARSVAGASGEAGAAAKSRGAGAAPRLAKAGSGAGAAARKEHMSGSQKRKARRKAVAEGRKDALTDLMKQRVIKKAAQRARKVARRQERRMLEAAGAGPALAGMIPANTS